MPTLTANGNLPIFVNAGGTALAATSASTARTNLGVTATGADTAYAFRANNLSDLANAATARTNLGLGSISTQAANSVSITGGSISGITDLAVADGGTGASDAATARTNLGTAALSGSTSQAFAVSNLAFPATQVPSADPNTLDDYEEGTWTPSLGGTATYSSRSGKYVKIGKFVHLYGSITVNTIGSGSTFAITGLPFSIEIGAIEGGGSVSLFISSASSITFATIQPDTAQLSIYSLTAAGVTMANNAIFQNGTTVRFSAWYFTTN
jgi:hypothetical protein